MTNVQKRELRQMAKDGYTFKEIKIFVECADSTIKKYIKLFGKKELNNLRIN